MNKKVIKAWAVISAHKFPIPEIPVERDEYTLFPWAIDKTEEDVRNIIEATKRWRERRGLSPLPLTVCPLEIRILPSKPKKKPKA